MYLVNKASILFTGTVEDIDLGLLNTPRTTLRRFTYCRGTPKGVSGKNVPNG